METSLTGTCIACQSELGRNGNGGVLQTPKISTCGSSPSDAI